MSKAKICFITPDLSAGGAERVISTLANKLALDESLEVHLIFMVYPTEFYSVNPRIIKHYPKHDFKKSPRIVSLTKLLFSLRRKLNEIKPFSLLSFGGKYNAFVLLASIGLGIKTYVSDRSRPGIRYGALQDFLNPILYNRASGIVSQTSISKDYYLSKNISAPIYVIHNPVPVFRKNDVTKEKMILNIGRFIKSKQQALLIDIFSRIGRSDWKLVFVGEGEHRAECEELAERLKLQEQVEFHNSTRDVASYYQRAAIFAFTSSSEGFPNALAEAMLSGCACISFNCVAGPSDIIQDGENGFLIPVHDDAEFERKLLQLTQDESLRLAYADKARRLEQSLSEDTIVSRYHQLLIS